MEHAHVVGIVLTKRRHTIDHTGNVVERIMSERTIIVDGVIVATHCIAEILEAHLLARDVLVGCHIALTEIIPTERLVLVE